ncbi:hypothetical protein [Halovenus sp. HT40]|uniref:hypothetical protein n=1 Tax=Halovenus sp. HT40 TaxID=3126691 RepID=UPI00300E828E
MSTQQPAVDTLAVTKYRCRECGETDWSEAAIRKHAYDEHRNTDNKYELLELGSANRQTVDSESQVHDTNGQMELGCPATGCQFSHIERVEYSDAFRVLQRHYWAEHDGGAATWKSETVGTVSKEVLEHLYVINKHARKFARLGTENYRADKKAAAKRNSVKKNALYVVKGKALFRIYEQADDCHLHTIDGSDFWLLDFGSVSFHSPLDCLSLRFEDVTETDTLEDFDAGEEKIKYSHELKESLLFLKKRLGICANYCVDQKYDHMHDEYVQRPGDRDRIFAGWKLGVERRVFDSIEH